MLLFFGCLGAGAGAGAILFHCSEEIIPMLLFLCLAWGASLSTVTEDSDDTWKCVLKGMGLFMFISFFLALDLLPIMIVGAAFGLWRYVATIRFRRGL